MMADVGYMLTRGINQRGGNILFEGRAGHAARHRPRHLPVRHLEQLRGRQRRRRRGRRSRTCCTTCSASPRPTPRAWAAARSRPSCRWTRRARWATTSRHGRPGARHRHRPMPRRCGWLDAAALKRSIIINGISGLCITKLDVLDGLPEIKVCVGYELNGQAHRHPAAGRRRHRGLRAHLRHLPRLERAAPSACAEDACPPTRALPRARSAVHRRADRMVSTGPDRALIMILLRPVPRLGRATKPPGEPPMLTDDGKHLYVSGTSTTLLIERPALKVHASGWDFDQILCLARGGMRPGDCRACSTSRWRSCRPVLPRRGSAPSRAASTWPSTSPAWANSPAARAAGRRPRRLGRHAQGGGRAAARHAFDLRTALVGDLVKASSYRPTTMSRCCRPAPGSTSRSRNTTLRPEGLAKKFAI